MKYYGFELKSFKSWDGRDGVGYQGSVWLNGRRLGTFHNDGDGGCTFFDFDTKPYDAAIDSRCTDLRESLERLDVVLGLEPDKGRRLTLEDLVAHMGDEVDVEARFRRWHKVASSKGLVLVTFRSDDGIGCHMLRDKPDGVLAEYVLAHEPGAYDVTVWRSRPEFVVGDAIAL